jgi:hypothetical protein
MKIMKTVERTKRTNSAVDGLWSFATLASMNSGCFAFDFGFAGAFYFWPGCLRARLR